MRQTSVRADHKPPSFFSAKFFGGVYAVLLLLYFVVGVFANTGADIGFAFIGFVFTAPVPLIVSLSLTAVGLRDWYFLNAPSDGIPPHAKEVQVFCKRWTRNLWPLALGLLGLSVWFFSPPFRFGLSSATFFAGLTALAYMFVLWVVVRMSESARARS